MRLEDIPPSSRDICPYCHKEGTMVNPVEKQYARGVYRGLACRKCVEAGHHRAYDESTEPDLIQKLRNVLAMTSSSNENESAAAMEHLNRLMTAHNLTIADLETRGSKTKPQVKPLQFDLGKAAFKWKLDLAQVIAEYYFCVPLVDRTAKTVKFLGRPENVESLSMLYGWMIDQIKKISADERRKYVAETGGHIDPLRWQVNFGVGIVSRLYGRLDEMARQRTTTVTDLVLSHKSEISDWAEEHLGQRFDGKPTATQRKWQEAAAAEEAELAELFKTNPTEFYRRRPWLHPDRIEAARAKAEKERKKKEKAARKRERDERLGTRSVKQRREDHVKNNQQYAAKSAGRERAVDINLQPFIKEK